MFRKPLFWVAFFIVSGLFLAFAVLNFPHAFPLINLDLRMDRQAALDQARTLAEERGWGPGDFRQAASFDVDRRTQAFVELDHGGKDAFAAMMRDDHYQAYRWHVRHFQEGETTETLVRFTPAGAPYGFRERLPEDEPGESVTPEEAREIAERATTADWGVDLGRFDLVEEAQEVRPGGRTDHTLVYERPDVQLGEGRYRLRLVVSGDRFTELSHFVKIPESFERRYEGMRSANNAIATGSGIAMVVLYIMGGCIVGLFFLLRDRWMLWRTAVLWGGGISLLMVLASINQLPLAWMGYDTAISTGNFLLQQIVLLLVQFFGMGALLAVSFIAAEGLTRRAFPDHPQFWRVWSRHAAGSTATLGRTVAGYLLVCIFLAYEVGLYMFAHDRLGWWSPSDSLLNPDVLAVYFPWLTSIAISTQAGFWEECLFRAVPIAGAALLGKRFGGRRWWILGALILQAVVFGAGHANYPGQPAYARLLELIIPSLGFGLVYLAFGLLPAIVCHYAFDVVLIALPLLVSRAPGVWVDQTIVVLLLFVPFWVVLAGWRRNRKWVELPGADYNRAWTPPPPPPAPPAPEPVVRPLGLPVLTGRVLLGLGVAGVLAFAFTATYRTDSPPLEVNRGTALAAAREALAERQIEIPAGWHEISTVSGGVSDADRFVWREGGADAYRELLGLYLPEPRWRVRYATFEGDVALRAEEYQVWVDRTGQVMRVAHQLPEAAPGATLSAEEARALAHSVLVDVHGLDPSAVIEVTAEPSKLPERTDWTFTFRDAERYPLEEGEARISVEIAGDEVARTYRFIDVPEEWERAERNRETITQVIGILSTIFVVLLFVAGAIRGVIEWSHGRFSVAPFVGGLLLMLVLWVQGLLNSWPRVSSEFSTAQPFGLQAGLVLMVGVMVALLVAGCVALNLGLLHRWFGELPASSDPVGMLHGFGLGALVAGLAAVIGRLTPAMAPSWADHGPAEAAVPLVAAILGPPNTYITQTILALLLFCATDRFTSGWTRRRLPGTIMLVVFGLVLAGSRPVEGILGWLGTGLIIGALLWAAYVLVLRFDMALIPAATGAVAILGTLRIGLIGPYPLALAGAVVGALVIFGLALFGHRLLSTVPRQTSPPM